MTPAARVSALIDLVTELSQSQKPADGFVSAYFRGRRYVGSKDRRFISEHFYNLLRFYGRLSWHVEQVKIKNDVPRLLVFAYFIFVEGSTAADIQKWCDGEKHNPRLLNKAEAEQVSLWYADPLLMPDTMPEQVRLECPDWAYESLQELFGDRFADIMMAMGEPALLHLRVNRLMTNREKAIEALQGEGIECWAGEMSPLAIHVKGRPALGQNRYFQQGWIEIQDEGSQLIALLCQAKEGQQIIDFCAGAGGKALALGAMMNNKGRLVASDIAEFRLKRAKERLRRANLHNVETRLLSTENDKWVKRSKGQFDTVLVDAPCSGTGTWRRNPDARWRQISLGLDRLLPLQQSILQSASRLVKSGGRLVYATCSLLPEENERQIQQFLANNNDFTLLPVREIWTAAVEVDCPIGVDDMMHLNPADHGTDGFFTAILQKK